MITVTENSQAVLPVPDALARIVRKHISTLKSEWLFLNSREKFFIAENVVRQALTPILDKLKIPRCGFHAFRHLHTSLLLSSGTASGAETALSFGCEDHTRDLRARHRRLSQGSSQQSGFDSVPNCSHLEARNRANSITYAQYGLGSTPTRFRQEP
jgi:integrase